MLPNLKYLTVANLVGELRKKGGIYIALLTETKHCQLAFSRPHSQTMCCPGTTTAHLLFAVSLQLKYVHRLLLLLHPDCRQYMAYTDQGIRTRTCAFWQAIIQI